MTGKQEHISARCHCKGVEESSLPNGVRYGFRVFGIKDLRLVDQTGASWN